MWVGRGEILEETGEDFFLIDLMALGIEIMEYIDECE